MWNSKKPNKKELENYKKVAELCARLLGRKIRRIK
jgi:hypothetical protein